MVCQACGSGVQGTFCSRCGAQVAAAPGIYGVSQPMRLVPRVQRHIQTLGIAWCIFGAYRLLAGLIGMAVLGTVFHGLGAHRLHGMDFGGGGMIAPPWIMALVPVVAVYSTIVMALSLLVGFSLLTRKPWGRTLAIVVGILALIKPLMGTALGIYTLWALAPESSAIEYDAIARER